jgi:hypothetical protein
MLLLYKDKAVGRSELTNMSVKLFDKFLLQKKSYNVNIFLELLT